MEDNTQENMDVKPSINIFCNELTIKENTRLGYSIRFRVFQVEDFKIHIGIEIILVWFRFGFNWFWVGSVFNQENQQLPEFFLVEQRGSTGCLDLFFNEEIKLNVFYSDNRLIDASATFAGRNVFLRELI